MAGGSNRVILTALAANVGIAVAKFIAAGITGSSAMLTEGVHSLVDSANHILLLYGGKRAGRAPDAKHPLGYGRELYFWSFVVAILVFALGAGVAVYEGIHHIVEPEAAGDPTIAFVVLGIAFALEGWSTWEALKAFNLSRGGRSFWQAIRDSKDAPTIVVLLENTGAMAGIVIATVGISISHATGDPRWDGAASVLIGLILGAIAMLLAVEAKGLLIGESADPELIASLHAMAAAIPGVAGVGEIVTVHHSPDRIVAGIDVDFDDAQSAAKVEAIVRQIEKAVSAQWPAVFRVFVRPISL